jgi:hypothetical protein
MAEMTIRRFGVFSVAKINGLLGFIIGLLIGLIYGLFLILFGAAMSALAPGGGNEALAGGVSTVVLGVITMIAFPIIYGFLGFLGGAISAVVYNLAAGMIGGIKFELEGVQQEYAPPPPPQQWAPSQNPAQ